MGTIPKSFGLEAATQGFLVGKEQCRKICTNALPDSDRNVLAIAAGG